MGRSFESIRQGVKDVAARWLKASKALKKEDEIYLAEMQPSGASGWPESDRTETAESSFSLSPFSCSVLNC